MNNKTILLLGSSGWVAHYLISDLKRAGFDVIGFSNSKKPHHQIENYYFDISDDNYISEVKTVRCDFIINALHSKDFDRSFEVHVALAQYCKESGKHYTYMSSSNALDGNPTKPHYEADRAFGGSDYGKYKAKCEHYLYENMAEALIIRFPATHGYAPNRIARTEEFLIQLKNKEKVTCMRGIYQCRPFVGHLSKMITKAILEVESGIFHMSATTESEEFEFLGRVAEAFGYSKEQVESGEELSWVMTIFPNKIFEKYGDEYKFTEKDTIEALAKCPNLQKYLNGL